MDLRLSTLQLSLLILGVVVLVLLLGYNAWQGRRNRRRIAKADGLASARAGGRVEPSLGADPSLAGGALGASGLSPAAALRDPLAAGAGGAGTGGAAGGGSDDPHAALAADANGAPALSEATDCIVELELEAPLPGARLLAVTQSLRRVGSKPVAFEGHDVAGGDWEPLAPTRAYGALRCGVLLANRHGPLNAMEFSELAAGLQPIAEQLSSLVHLPDMTEVLTHARELDARCSELDAQVGLNIEVETPPSPEDLRGCAEATGLVERGNSLYARLGSGGVVLFSLALGPAANQLTLLLDVPRAPASEDPWRQMVDCAVTCAARLGGRIVDDDGRPLDLPALERIEEQLAERWTALDRAGFPAGSPAALRLFN